jgi:CSLREA domain-containing protein
MEMKLSITRSCTVFLTLLALIFSAIGVFPVRAAGIIVNSLLDTTAVDTFCTLREAIENANNNAATNADCTAGSGADTITFSISGTIALGSTLPNIADGAGLTIDGTGHLVTLSGGDAVRVMSVNDVPLTLDHLTIADGSSANAGGIYNLGTLIITDCTISGNTATSALGGGIYNGKQLTVTNSTFTGNSAPQAAGGSIYNTVTTTIINSTFSNNSAYDGGGIYNNGNSLTVRKSTFSGNSADASNGNGGAIYNNGPDLSMSIGNSTFSSNSALNGGGIYSNDGTVYVVNSTFSGNHVGGAGAGIYRSAGTVHLQNTILANSLSGGNCGGTIANGGHNIDSGTTCGLGSTNGSLSTTDPLLGTLTGSPAWFLLNNGSRAIDAGDDAVCAASPVDNESQNGVTRPRGLHCDIGSVEVPLLKIFLPVIMR